MGSFQGLKLGINDTISVTTHELHKGDSLFINDSLSIQIQETIPAGHKVALKKIELGENVIKYGHSIGIATKNIESGDWVHTHNLSTALEVEWSSRWHYVPPQITPPFQTKNFMGYRRSTGRVGIRN
ncbi:MAG: SAF domain-containing protein [Aminobacterium sp.]|nr:SAF domain-containing protein [Aminobacterium sp.]